MCGFVGILRFEGSPVEAQCIEKMLKPLEHRGPDDRGLWLDGNVAFGHLRLSILDLSQQAHQPIKDSSNGSALVYNGEVYNYKELRAELEQDGIEFLSSGDTEVVLKALGHWGPERAIPRFNGMFALAYYDTEKKELWLVRDRLGIKPLYAAWCGNDLVFASEPKGILAHPGMQARPDRLAVASFVLRGRPDPRLTLYEGIVGLEPGSWWRVSARKTVQHRWFHVLDILEPERIISSDPRSFVRSLDQALVESVGIHLASDVPLATICSGGVDSSLITAIACRCREGLQSFVADVDSPGSEGEQAQHVADHLGIPLIRHSIGKEGFLRSWPEAVASGGPCFHRSDVALLMLVRRCHDHGIKVLLNGEGADELFGGYLWQEAEFLLNDRWSRLRRLLVPVPRWRKQAVRYLADIRFKPLPGLGDPTNRTIAVVDGDGEIRRKLLLDKLEPIHPRADRAFLARCLDDLYFSLDTLLRRHDRMSMASSVEMRVPFIENGLIDFGIHLPRKAKYRRGESKWVLKQVAKRYLPDDIVFARKKAFPLPAEYDAGCELLLQGGAAGELLHWTNMTTRALVDAARQDHRLRFILVGVELWARLSFRGDLPQVLAEELVAAASG